MPQYILKVYCHQCSVLAVYTANLVYHILQLSGYPALQYMTMLHIHFNIVAVYLQYILQTSWSEHSVYTATILPYTVSLLHFSQGYTVETYLHAKYGSHMTNGSIFLGLGTWTILYEIYCICIFLHVILLNCHYT